MRRLVSLCLVLGWAILSAVVASRVRSHRDSIDCRLHTYSADGGKRRLRRNHGRLSRATRMAVEVVRCFSADGDAVHHGLRAGEAPDLTGWRTPLTQIGVVSVNVCLIEISTAFTPRSGPVTYPQP
jgi:hypothetical protein